LTALAIINGIAIVVLVLVTAYYAWQTHEMAGEMKQARLLSLAPYVRLDIRMLAPGYGVPVARNVGTGPAIDCDLHLHFRRSRPHDRPPAMVGPGHGARG
jgi:hypothetical protein